MFGLWAPEIGTRHWRIAGEKVWSVRGPQLVADKPSVPLDDMRLMMADWQGWGVSTTHILETRPTARAEMGSRRSLPKDSATVKKIWSGGQTKLPVVSAFFGSSGHASLKLLLGQVRLLTLQRHLLLPRH